MLLKQKGEKGEEKVRVCERREERIEGRRNGRTEGDRRRKKIRKKRERIYAGRE